MKWTDQTLVVPALLALRDKYRRLAIRTQERGLKALDKKTGAMRLGTSLSGFMECRDYYIYAAEAVDALIPKILGEPSPQHDVEHREVPAFNSGEGSPKCEFVDFRPEAFRSDMEGNK